MCRRDNPPDRKQLMKIGIALIITGHLNFVLGAIVHGTVLRHLTLPGNGVVAEYSVTTIFAAISGILTICTGIAVIVLSGNMPRTFLDTTLAMWVPCLLLTGLESFLSIKSFFISMNLLGAKQQREQVIRKPLEQIQEVDEDSELLATTTVKFWV
ncbi:keratinocyte-associated protein 3-like isoform X2 [Amblyraja radiata]|uniref:keratinocyte-associated protein 3-like isoform X2 n=1 Tax=Amblyraja radiata TaxID=386614 RepID=UPI0014040600|nr:keratinocyte-associated protein 3-like isoform X2 [Amblyraja radiata]